PRGLNLLLFFDVEISVAPAKWGLARDLAQGGFKKRRDGSADSRMCLGCSTNVSLSSRRGEGRRDKSVTLNTYGQPRPCELDLKPGTCGHGCPGSNLESA